MHNGIDVFLEQMRASRSAGPSKWFVFLSSVTEVGDLELRIPRTRTFSGRVDPPRFARRTVSIERTISDVLSARSVHPKSWTGLVIDPGRTGQSLDGQRHCKAARSSRFRLIINGLCRTTMKCWFWTGSS